MGRTLGIAVALGWMVLSSMELRAQGSEAARKLTVLVCDMAGTSATARASAKVTATGIFQRSGIDLDWIDVSTENCALPSMEKNITVIITPQAPKDWASRNAMGFAPANTGERPRVYVFMNLVRTFVGKYIAGEPSKALGIILGDVIVHELGHLLIPGEAHSSRGIMSTKWTYDRWIEATSSRLQFLPEHEAIIRARLK